MASINVILDLRRQQKNGTYPVYLRLIHNRVARNIKTQIEVEAGDWNPKKGLVRATHPHAHQYNHRINDLRNTLEKRLVELGAAAESLSVDQLKEKLFEKTRPRKTMGFSEFGEELVLRYKEARKIGSAKSYECCIRKIQAFRNHKDFALSEIDYNFLLAFELYCISTGLKVNAIGVYMRHLRSMLNQAQKAGYLDKNQYPFEHYSIKKESTAKRAISKEDLGKLLNLSLSQRPGLVDTLNYFTFMFHARGMNFADLCVLKSENVQQGRLVYRRQKTGKLYNIKLTPKAEEILSIYKRKGATYLFPIIQRSDDWSPMDEWNRIKDARKKFNRELKTLGKLAGIETPITSYVIRHSWATIAKFSGIAPAVIGESLGHSDLKTTETYLAQFDHEVLDKANELIVDF